MIDDFDKAIRDRQEEEEEEEEQRAKERYDPKDYEPKIAGISV